MKFNVKDRVKYTPLLQKRKGVTVVDVGHYFAKPRKTHCVLFVLVLVILVSSAVCRFAGIRLEEPG